MVRSMQRSTYLHRPLLAFAAALAVLILISYCVTPPEKLSVRDNRERTQPFQFSYSHICSELVNTGGWIGEPLVSCEPDTQSVATCGKGHDNNWQWSTEASLCNAHRRGAEDIISFLGGKWIVIAGDSVARNMYAALLRVLSNDGECLAKINSPQIIYGHQDFEHMLPGSIKASFYWLPYATNLTERLKTWSGEKPHAVLSSIGLWHMLHVTSAEAFQSDFEELRSVAQEFGAPNLKGYATLMSMCSITEVFRPKLRTREKTVTMTEGNVDAYNRGIAESNIMYPNGTMHLVDIHRLTEGCGPQCTSDGIHYSNTTYDAAVQIWATSLYLFRTVKKF